MIRRRFVFKGRVQGVGFRWRAEKAADMFRCTGWCRNEWAGSVTMEIQGREEGIDQVAFFKKILFKKICPREKEKPEKL